MVADHLPARGSQRHRRLPERAGNGPQRFLGRDHDHRQNQEAERQAAGPERRAHRQPLDPERPGERRQAEQAVDDRGHPGQVGDVELDQPPEPAQAAAYSSRKTAAPDADRDRHRRHQPEQPQAPERPRPGTPRSPGRPTAIDVIKRAEDRPDRPPRPAPLISEGPTTAPSMIDSTTTPLDVATRQARPNSGPSARRLPRFGS